uniref:Uncharacterized protein n=1 Tax=Glossina austeni TaxID=7395 RepID=A0A1A9VT07_GLOAU
MFTFSDANNNNSRSNDNGEIMIFHKQYIPCCHWDTEHYIFLLFQNIMKENSKVTSNAENYNFA